MTSVMQLAARYLRRHIRTRYKLSQAYLSGDGIEIGALHNPLPISRKARVTYVDRLSRDELYCSYPELRGQEIVDPDLIDDGEVLAQIDNLSLDFIVANHFIEHCENPIAAIQNFFAKLKPCGILYMAVPDKRFTFDRQRVSTSVDHLESDYLDGGRKSRSEHYLDFARHALSNDDAGEPELGKLARDMMEAKYSIHFHVWTFDEFLGFLHWLKDRHLNELEILEAKLNRREGVFILRKKVDVRAEYAAG